MILIVWFLFCLMSTFGYTYLFCKFNNVEKLSKFSILLFFLGVIVITFLKLLNIKYFTIFSYFIFYPFLFYYIKKMSFKKIMINTLVIGLFGLVADMLSMLFVSIFCIIFNISFEEYYNIFSIFMSILVFLSFIFLAKCKKIKSGCIKFINFFNDIEYLDYFLFIFCACVVVATICIAFNLNNIKSDILLLIIMFLLVILFLVLIKYNTNNGYFNYF